MMTTDVPTFVQVEETLVSLIEGRISREDADLWAGQWVYRAEAPRICDPAIWRALIHIAGCDLRPGKGLPYLHSSEQFAEWLEELRSGAAAI